MRRFINIFVVLVILFAFLIIDYHFIRKVFAIDPPSSLTSWIRALPLQPGKRSAYVEWTSVAGAVNYDLERAANGATWPTEGNFASIFKELALGYIDNNLNDNWYYVYRVRSVNADAVYSTYSTNATFGFQMKPSGLKWEEVY